LARFGLADRATARPGELSGGQAQRVALARAIATEPRVLLLDEPLAALDAGARIDIRNELRARLAQASGARLIVTHDPIDAAAISDRVVILEGGRIVQDGPMEQISMHPRSRYVADLVGLNFFRGAAQGGMVSLDGTGGTVVIADGSLSGPVFLAVHPRAVTIQLGDARASARNQWAGRIVALDQIGDRVRVQVEGVVPIVAEVTTESVWSLRLAPGCDVVAAVKATEVQVYSAHP
jgi:molybdate transport system ATP-binding protein